MNNKTALYLVSIGIVAVGLYNFIHIQTSTACPQDAKRCPDGTYVSRVGSHCEFGTCPNPSQATSETANWKTYKNTTYGFSVQYPNELTFEDLDYINRPADVELLSNTFTTLFTDKSKKGEIMIRIFDKKVPLHNVTNNYFGTLSNDWKDITIENLQGKTTNALDNQTRKKVGKVAYIAKGNHIYYFHITEFFDKNIISESIFDQILSTFKFTQ